jgi:hypothetical protein
MDYGNEYFHYTGIFSDHETKGCCEYLLTGLIEPQSLQRLSNHNDIHNMGALPDGTRTRADLAVVVERVLILPSTTLPSAPRGHTHTSMARRRFLPWKKSSPFGEIRTH